MLLHLTQYSLLSPDQFGFLPKRSATLQLLICLDNWTEALDAGAPVDIIFIDFARAFDSVAHGKLCHKLQFYGFDGTLVDWITDFLANRTQSVTVGNAISTEINVTSGVPQGSVLGPLLFVIFINDLNCNEFGVETPKFADDVLMHNKIIADQDHLTLQNALASVETWSIASQLPIATAKCSVMHLGKSNDKIDYIVSGML